jgi:hypothetical protein
MSNVNDYSAEEFDRDLDAGEPVELVVKVRRLQGPSPLYTVSTGRRLNENAGAQPAKTRAVVSGQRQPAAANR